MRRVGPQEGHRITGMKEEDAEYQLLAGTNLEVAVETLEPLTTSATPAIETGSDTEEGSVGDSGTVLGTNHETSSVPARPLRSARRRPSHSRVKHGD